MSDPDIRPNRLDKSEIDRNFADLHPPLSRSEALIEADRCYFCFAAPCTDACPTGIDIPVFIRQIQSGNLRGSARTILEENIMGGMCARVCPTEVLCEEACVRNTHEEKPVAIGLLQRHATDPVIEAGEQLFSRRASTGKRIAVVGAGPAGLSCAHRLAMLGHDVKVFNRDPRSGGLNEYGIAAYKSVNDFAQREVDYILAIGGIEIETGVTLGKDIGLEQLRADYDAVFLGMGLASVNEFDIDNADLPGVVNAVDYIADLRQAPDKSDLPVGRHVVVIGGGMTAIDIAVQSKRLGAENVDIAYRRGPDDMSASEFERRLAQTSGVSVHYWLQPRKLQGDGHVRAVEFDRIGEPVVLAADIVFKAIGQRLGDQELADELKDIDLENGRIRVDANQSTSLEGVWAGGDCIAGGEDLTVSAVQHGKVAAHAIDRYLGGDHG
jgi:dihydropyrimidine dehydrogenase (NAD+) subunit PreT